MKYKIYALVLASALTRGAFAQTATTPDTTGSCTNSRQVENDGHHDYGWIRLLSLIGLAGLRRQIHPGMVGTRRN